MLLKDVIIGINHLKDHEYQLVNPYFSHFITPQGGSVCDYLYYLYHNVDANYYGVMGEKRYFNFSKENATPREEFLNEGCVDRYGYTAETVIEQTKGFSLIIYQPEDIQQVKFPPNYAHNLRNYLEIICKSKLSSATLIAFESSIKNDYSEFSVALDELMKGHEYFHLLNFIMDKTTFCRYCSILFDILARAEKAIDSQYISYLGMGYKDQIAQLLLGLFEKDLLLKQPGCTKRQKIITFKNTDTFPEIFPAFETRNIPIVSLSSDLYSPYLAVWLQSIMDCSSPNNNYDVIILESEITTENKKMLLKMVGVKDNFSLRFVNPKPLLRGARFHVVSVFYSEEAYYRIFTPWVLKNYSKLIVMDCDIVAMADLSELYSMDIGERPIGGFIDIVYQGLINSDRSRYNYTKYEMGMQDPYEYINTGVMIMDLEKVRELFDLRYLIEFCSMHDYKIQEQDALNVLFDKKVTFLDNEWNYCVNLNPWISGCIENAPVKSKCIFTQASPKLIHYANRPKPWFDPSVPYSAEFWHYAKRTPYYELILYRMAAEQYKKAVKPLPSSGPTQKLKGKTYLKEKIIKPLVKPFFPIHSMRREYAKELAKKLLGRANRLEWVQYYIKQYMEAGFNGFLSLFPWTLAHKNQKALLSLKDKYKGKRCFFVGLGPSLRIEDIEKLENEVTFAVNNVFALYELTDWRPKYYFNQETIAKGGNQHFEDLKDKLSMCGPGISFFPLNRYSKTIGQIVRNTIFLPIVNDWITYYGLQMEMDNFSVDCSRIVRAAYLSMYSLLQVVAYLGFKEIYLIGCDAKYTVERPHCYACNSTDKRIVGTVRGAILQTSGINKGFNAMRYAAEQNDIRIYNATRGGCLEIFPRVDFDSLELKEKES